MARYSGYDTSRIYEAADAFRNNCLVRDGSLLFEQASLWRPELLESIHKAFVATPDEGPLLYR
jgi:5-methylcytosine-specific restriction protein B